VRWPWRRPGRVPEEAEQAVQHAERLLEDAKNLDARAQKAADTAAEIRRVNHIAAAMARAIKGV